ncbi:MAG: MOSC domain-containing protein [Candidatus Binatia bacterium]
MDSKGTVVSIHVASTGAAPMRLVKEIQAVQGKGLEGDRYANKRGTYSNDPGSGRAVTLIESEAVEALKRDYHVELDAGQSRRNIVTHGVSLNHLVGKDFRVGEVTLRGTRLCEPCSHMEKLTVKGALRGLIHRGGLRAEVVKSGTIRVGDGILLDWCTGLLE